MRADRRFVVAIIASYVAAGLALPWSPYDETTLGPVNLAHIVLLSFLFFGWCKAHARAIGIKPPFAAPFLMGSVALLGMPYYAVRVLGWGAGAWLCVKAAALLIAATLLSGAGAVASSLVRA